MDDYKEKIARRTEVFANALVAAVIQLEEREAQITALQARIAELERSEGDSIDRAARLAEWLTDQEQRAERAEADLAAARAVIERARDIMQGGEGVQDQGEAWDLTVRVLDAALTKNKP